MYSINYGGKPFPVDLADSKLMISSVFVTCIKLIDAVCGSQLHAVTMAKRISIDTSLLSLLLQNC